ncbi:hypothetical protein BGW39_003237 [Mortierella sp. 14UC]|nr:hypothetical protein BGW39_003237 [Mortierella sp. 14UC]
MEHYHTLIKDRIPILAAIALPHQDLRPLSPPLGLPRRRAILSYSIMATHPAHTRPSRHRHHHLPTQPMEELGQFGHTTPITHTLTIPRHPRLNLKAHILGHILHHPTLIDIPRPRPTRTHILPSDMDILTMPHRQGHHHQRPEVLNHAFFTQITQVTRTILLLVTLHKRASPISSRRPSQSNRAQGSAATGGPQQPPTSSQQSMAMDEDDDDDDDDGEIKQETRGRRRSNSLTSGLAQDGGANKKQAQDGDHADTHKCTECGKVYKHPNCLWKHRWLHSQYWKSATKFLLSKHQQVQLMEAAAILLGMDESRQGDNDPIVSMFSKQRGALANSVGSGSSSSSASPPTYTKSLSGSPPPQSERQQQQRGTTTGGTRIATTEVQHADIQMLTALRGGHASLKAISTSFPTPTPPTTATAAAPAINSSATKTATTSTSLSQSSSPSNSKSGVALPSTASSSRSTPPTLTADDESVLEMDEEMTIVTPPSRGESTPIIPVARVLEKLGGGPGVSVGVVGMGIGMDVDALKHQHGSQAQGLSKQGQAPSHQHQQNDYRGGEDRYRYSGYQHQQQQQQSLPFNHQPHLQGPAHPYGGNGGSLGHPHQGESQQQHSRPHQHHQQPQQYRS